MCNQRYINDLIRLDERGGVVGHHTRNVGLLDVDASGVVVVLRGTSRQAHASHGIVHLRGSFCGRQEEVSEGGSL